MNKGIAKPNTIYFLGFDYLKQGGDQHAEKRLKEPARRTRRYNSASWYSVRESRKKAAKKKPGRRFRELRNNGTKATNCAN